jgi:hypothetical protein
MGMADIAGVAIAVADWLEHPEIRVVSKIA